jgi:hypothetical protein
MLKEKKRKEKKRDCSIRVLLHSPALGILIPGVTTVLLGPTVNPRSLEGSLPLIIAMALLMLVVGGIFFPPEFDFSLRRGLLMNLSYTGLT